MHVVLNAGCEQCEYGEVIKINLAPQCLPLTSVSESILSVNEKLGSSVHFLSRLAPVQVPIAQVCASCTEVAITLHFPLVRKQVALIVITDLPLPPEGYSMFNPFNLYQTQMEAVGNDVFCLLWKQSSILTEFERHLQEGMLLPRGYPKQKRINWTN